MTRSATVSQGVLAPDDNPTGAATPPQNKRRFWALALGSVGVVYGDIGTSPLYALKESLVAASAGGAVSHETVFGVVSLVLWALVVVVTLKYVLLVMRMDNGGEGGTLSLMALVQRAMGQSGALIVALGMMGAALFYGDAVITPAISVLSAIEGLELVAPSFHPYILHVSIGILVILFAVQSRGTAAVAAWFGPIMTVWFAAIAAGGLLHIAQRPEILGAVSPIHGVRFLLGHGMAGLVALGAVFLAVTGAEALYADMGHFGRSPIQIAWVGLVLPALAINYLGQGALLLSDPGKLENPFFLLFPSWALLPMVILATLATIIASQAVITGAFSLTHQAMQLGLLPRFEVRRTSETEMGQIYISRVNWLLLLAVVFLVGVFRSSGALASAYGIAVTGTMVVTAIMAFLVLRRCWAWSVPAAALLIAPFLIVDVVFLLANMLKIVEGGWMPLLTGTGLMLMMITWRKGARILLEKAHRQEVPLVDFIRMLEKSPPERVRGLAIFLTGSPDLVPSALLHNLKHNRVLHKHNIVLCVVVEERPSVDPAKRATLKRLSESFSQVTLRFGYMETPDVPKALRACRTQDWSFDIMQTSFFLSRRALRPAPKSRMPKWQDMLFISLARSASDVSQHFGIPTSRAVEVGSQVTV